MRITKETAVERVARGVALLDAVDPGWFNRIHLPTLELWNCHRCVLGQLRGEYWDGAEWLFKRRYYETGALASAHGFYLVYAESDDDGFNYHRLTEAWLEVIAARQKPIILARPAEELELVGV